MPSLTDGEIRKVILQVERSQKEETLKDGEGRGVGRLVLIIKPMPTRVTADWMVQQYRDGRRVKRKIGSYPATSLVLAREIFERDYAKVIQKGKSIKLAVDDRAGSVRDLFDAYVEALEAAGKKSAEDVKKCLDKVAAQLGPQRLARDIEPDEIVEAIRPIYQRDKRAMADHVRSYIRSAYGWGLKSEHDYRNASPRRFQLTYNPAAGIPTEPKVQGTRWLREEEFVRLYRWLEFPDTPVHKPYLQAIQILMLTGQRVQEIASLHVSQWDAKDQLLDWHKTKNESQHALPVPSLAAELMASIKPNQYGWFFPSMFNPKESVTHGTLYSFLWRQRGRGVIPHVTNRDLRRTWKTLTGKAGISKEIRDRIQNHALQDVSSKNYDRWNYMPEKRAAMKQWDAFVRNLLAEQNRRKAA